MFFSTTFKSARPSPLCAPLFWLGFVLVLLIALLSFRLNAPIGPMYWDSYIYFDATQRIRMGQIPGVDFSTPVGPLGYYLFGWGHALFPQAQPLLLVQWSILAVAAPLMAWVLAEIRPHNRTTGFLILVPFLVFAIFPANTQSFYPYPGLDGFGIYNRHTSLLLYVLMCGLLFMRNGTKLALFCAAVMLTLLLMKVTGFLAGGLFGLAALLAGRISTRNVLLAAAATAAFLLALELHNGIISGYIRDIATLVTLNEEALLPRFLTVISLKLDVILPTVILVLALFWNEQRQSSEQNRFFDRSSVWLAIGLLGGIILETQNTGSQEFIFLWPILLLIFQRIKAVSEKLKIAFVLLAAFCVIPTFTKVVHRTLRAVAVAPTYVEPSLPELKNLGQVLTRPDFLQRAELFETHYPENNTAYDALAAQGQLPSWQLYSEIDFQVYWLVSANQVVKDLKSFETQKNLHLQSIMSLDFVNPFAWILDRDATRHIQIGADPFRTVPALSKETKAAVEATDGILRPKCPTTTNRLALQKIYAEALQDRAVVALNPCWDLLLRPGLIP
ncbi:hypothetical protein F9K85_05425 [Brucella tritici]|uniref:Glycosyltransferase RgtA/B/C/D-like domain-containing protein n=1 Tax=Brucella tritici TaxID=94626 RepID=A0A6N6QRD0_9HYPH|nr:hypothetical protein [Brucella tritici]KAB2677871.1 hypothetical protein F9K85_05425 [Brucella tritici]KAB2687848.1 hypothetical protein F9L08_06475 [Brucella tritici]